MRKPVLFWVLAVWLTAISAVAAARLPAPSPQEAKASQVAAEKKAKADDAARQALVRAQDRVVARHKSRKR